jgi:salicylate hydroxylase
MMERAETVLIAGGGIAGLALALALAKHGIASRILERETAIAGEGAGIQLGPNAVRILQSLGVAPNLESEVAAPSHLAICDGISGKALTELPLGDAMANRFGAPYWTLHRADLRAALLTAAMAEPAIAITTGFEAARMSETGDAVTLTSTAGETRKGLILAGADGLWSRVRHMIFGEVALPHSGYVAYRTVLPREDVPRALAGNAVHIWLAPKVHAVHYPVRGGREVAAVVVLEELGQERGWHSDGAADHVRRHTSGLSSEISSLISAAKNWRKWALADARPFPAWSKGRCVLLGDAAHPVLPFLAQGGALALEDAAVLASAIAKAPASPAAAISAFENLRCPRAARVQAAARRNGRIYHLGGWAARARNRVLTARDPAQLMHDYDWLYGWRDWD